MAKPLATQKPVIDPKELIAELSVEELNRYSDEYYARLPLPDFQLAKPFSMVADAAEHFRLLGLLLGGLRMQPGLRVLDFGAGTCWLTKMIWRMGCPVVALDVSQRALDLGKRLFADFPVPLAPDAKVEFLRFDGRRIDLPDASVDRVVCYDVFHHVPNPEEVMAEFFRVLAPGGIAGFSEPLGAHSSTPESQSEMRTYTVLENDIDLDALCATARAVGFDAPRFVPHPLAELEISLEERRALCRGQAFPDRIADSIRDAARSSGVFFFDKGKAALDSRSPRGLRHEIRVDRERMRLKVGEVVTVQATVRNVGEARWLSGDPTKIGTVNVGTQLFDADGRILRVDLTRGKLSRDVPPGETIEVAVPVLVPEPGNFRIGFDMVAELVTWFQVGGSKLAFVDVEVE